MLALCAWLGLTCATATALPPDTTPRPEIAPPKVAAISIPAPKMRPPKMRPPKIAVAAVWPECPVRPPTDLVPIFVKAGRNQPGVSACEIAKKAWCESNFRVDAVSSAPAFGVMQFVEPTANQYEIDPLDPEQAIPAGAHFTAWCRARWSPDNRTHDDIQGLGDACYEWSLQRAFASQREHGWYVIDEAIRHFPESTQRYIFCNRTGAYPP